MNFLYPKFSVILFFKFTAFFEKYLITYFTACLLAQGQKNILALRVSD